MKPMLQVVPPPNAIEDRPRVAVLDDHAFMRDLIARELTRGNKPYDVVAAIGTAAEAISICRRLKPNLLVLDIKLPDQTGVAAVPDIRRASPATRILLCTAFPTEDWISEKTNTWDDFLLALDRVSRGHRYFCSGGAPRRENTGKPAIELTPREREILKLIAEGMTTKEIAGRLFISIPTVETHRANLMTKTAARNVAGLVRFAMNAGLL